jgi:fructoselysine-6-P-deglycase FrlB-like protein
MANGENARVGDRVSFRISDVFLPEPSEVLANLTGEVEANGVVVEFSDSGNSPRVYAVVRITAQQMVLLPVSALHVLNCS